jgi:hypothetical protein
MAKTVIILTLTCFLINLKTFSQQELRLNLTCSPSFILHEESFIKENKEIYNQKSLLYYGLGIGYQLTEKINIGTEYAWIRRVVSIETPGKDFDIKLRHVSIPIYIDWRIADSVLLKDFPIIVGIGGILNYLGDNETRFNSQSNTETYEGFFRFYERNKIVPGVLLKIATEKKIKRIGILSLGISYHYIFSSDIITECQVDYQTSSISGEIRTSDHSDYSLGFIQLSFKYIYPINLTR